MNASLQEWWDKIRHSGARDVLLENRNEIKKCPFCDNSTEDRVISIYEELVSQLYAIYRWCGQHKRHEFAMKDIRGLLDFNGYTRFNDLIRCSNGVLYRPTDEESKKKKRGDYGINMARAKEFFTGKRSIHLQISLNQITHEKVVLKDVMIGEVPVLNKLLDSEGVYDYEKLL
jgi:hypothetical protein